MLEEIEFPLLAKLSRLMAILVVALLLRSPVYSQRTDIRRVDFANFTYPWTADLIDPANSRKTFTLKAGKLPAAHDEKGHVDEMGVYLQLVSYGDVTGDGLEEAILSMSIQTGGSAIPGLVYVCTLRNNRPRLLWFFSTGD
ncbi:MAG: hypothetical protein ACRD9R_10280, partial [Pyrinomonadaceae bacterium]